MTVTDADGVSGHLLWSLDRYVFRVYDRSVEPWTFKDYDLRHCDLTVTINDKDATFYEYDDGSMALDHSPITLGNE